MVFILEDIFLKEEDFENIDEFLKREHIELNEYEMYNAGNYCILSAVQDNSTHQRVYRDLIYEGFDTPDNIIQDSENFYNKLYDVIKIAHFPNQKTERIVKFAHWWKETDLHRDILHDAENGRENEFHLRNKLAKEAPGLGLKCASLYMIKCGYENVVPVDIVLLKFLDRLGYEVEIPNYKDKSGPKYKEYLELEKIAINLTKKEKILELTDLENISPAILQAAVWRRYSTYREEVIDNIF